jgi:hypothetical protein
MRQVLYCDCHGTEGLASRRDDKLVIVARRHGQNHVLVLNTQPISEVVFDKAEHATVSSPIEGES